MRAALRRQVGRRHDRKRLGRRIGRTEFGAVAIGLFEVVPDDLVALDELGVVAVEPIGELFVEVCAGRLGERLVGCIAD